MNKEDLLGNLQPIKLAPIKNKPLVSVIIANYNYGKYIEKAIQSVIVQTYSNYEIIICDDGSSDDSCQIIERIQNKNEKLKLFKKTNGGQASALNLAFEKSSGDIICILDADDLFFPDKLEITVEQFVLNYDCGFLTHKVIQIDADGTKISTAKPNNLFVGWGAAEAIKNGGRVSLPPASGLCFRREIMEILFPIPILFKANADGYLAELAQFITPIIAVEKVLAYFRIHGNNLSSNFKKFPNPEILKKTFNIYTNTHEEKVSLLSKLYGKDVADLLHIEESMDYISFNLALYILENNFLDNSVKDAKYLIKKNKSKIKRIIWTLLILFPNTLSVRLLRLWWSSNKVKRFTYILINLIKIRT